MAHQPIPVSKFPDELVFRAYRNRVSLPGVFDHPPIPSGTVLYIRRSPGLASARSCWIEDADGNLMALCNEERLRRELERADWPHLPAYALLADMDTSVAEEKTCP